MDEAKEFEVVRTRAAMITYQERILPYLFENFTFQRAQEIDNNIFEKASTLKKNPERGTIEKYLSGFNEKFRYILFRENRNFVLKVVFLIKEVVSKVFITDFFSTKMNPQKMIK